MTVVEFYSEAGEILIFKFELIPYKNNFLIFFKTTWHTFTKEFLMKIEKIENVINKVCSPN